MNRKILALLLSLAFLGCIAFGFLWIMEKNNTADYEQVCTYAAGNANARFWDYLSYGNDYDYHYGVAELTTFYDAYCILCMETQGERNTNCVHLNQLLGELMDYPVLNEEQIKTLVELTGLLKENPGDGNAYVLVFSLYNELSR